MNKLFLRILMLPVFVIPITPLQAYQPTNSNVRIPKTSLSSPSSQNIVFSQREKTILIGGGIALVMVGCAYYKYCFKKPAQKSSTQDTNEKMILDAHDAKPQASPPIKNYIKPDNLFIQKIGAPNLKILPEACYQDFSHPDKDCVISFYQDPQKQDSYILAAVFGLCNDKTSVWDKATSFAQKTFALFFHRAFVKNKNNVGKAFIVASEEINTEIEQMIDPNDPQPGTTATAILIKPGWLYVASVGGPKVYLNTDDNCDLISPYQNKIRGLGYKYINRYITPELQGDARPIEKTMIWVSIQNGIMLFISDCLEILKT